MNFFKIFPSIGRFLAAVVLLLSCFYSLIGAFSNDVTGPIISFSEHEWKLKIDEMDLNLAVNDSSFVLRVNV